MANAVMILGKSGTGKSTAIKTLDPKNTLIINVLKKRLPFKGSSGMYSKEAKNLFNVDDYAMVCNLLEAVNKKEEYKNVVIDDMGYIMRKEFFMRAKEAGFQKYTDFGAHFQKIISTIESMRDDVTVFMILHCEEIISDNIIVGYKVATVGKLLDTTYNPIEVVPTVLFSAVRYDEKGLPSYGFITHRIIDRSAEIPAKSPDGMFDEEFIPNDLQYVVDKMNEYYN